MNRILFSNQILVTMVSKLFKERVERDKMNLRNFEERKKF